MMNITAADVNKLRTMTGAGMMDCKKALTEAEGDFEKAVELLRKKGQKVAASRGDRDATEASADNTSGYIIVLNCETDFVAKNDGFVTFANSILDAAIANNANSPEAVKALTYPGTSLTIEEKITEEIGKIGEKIDLSTASQINAGFVYCYNHPGNKLASIVGFNKETSADVAKDVAMQTAAMAPVALDETSVPEELKQKEIEIGKELAINEGKPA
ncbi:MAG: translation elongation factor Ts, partial [Flavobacteriales bacterium]|nr:translation elongation factor Ts [Flavobacteriales bacterium]